jgi:hypothetical protein
MPDYTPYVYPHPENKNPVIEYPLSIGIGA